MDADHPSAGVLIPRRFTAGVATKTHVLNLLHRLTDGKAPPASPIEAPQALGLKREPLANVERYDALRDRGLPHAS